MRQGSKRQAPQKRSDRSVRLGHQQIGNTPLARALQPGKAAKPTYATPRQEPEITAESVRVHALETFGSVEKTEHWLNRPNHVFQGRTPLQAIESEPSAVEAELTRVDH